MLRQSWLLRWQRMAGPGWPPGEQPDPL